VHRRVAVFVDGCFWHGCPQHGTTPRANGSYWQAKLARNRKRDVATTAALTLAGWTVVRVWEHNISGGAQEVERVVRGL
jgi:DNA mismatch endonuclease (patch repair protein)